MPEGWRYREDFLSHEEEAALLERIDTLDLREAVYKGYTARRRIASFGTAYDFERLQLLPGPALPEWLLPLRARCAAWLAVPEAALSSALVAHYAPGTPLGWHRDVPDFEAVVGVSLLSACRMRMRRYPPVAPRRADALAIALQPRSAYALQGTARWGWQHNIAPTPGLRYSVTFRTRSSRGGQPRIEPSDAFSSPP